MSKVDISQQLARLMRENGVSQSGLSRGCGVPQPTINRILNEKTKEPRRESVVRIANFFGVDPESMYQEPTEVREDGDPVARLYQQMSGLRPNQLRRLFSMLAEELD
ncbi:MAG: helix-turn-helix domain-containing protein [Porticoccaceae bacterium]|tara:strand:+ start:8269 stop:8589 length:321 start_codon:yes stop_codon:yes gene_type:complete